MSAFRYFSQNGVYADSEGVILRGIFSLSVRGRDGATAPPAWLSQRALGEGIYLRDHFFAPAFELMRSGFPEPLLLLLLLLFSTALQSACTNIRFYYLFSCPCALFNTSCHEHLMIGTMQYYIPCATIRLTDLTTTG
jgi:hypothetical protein